VQPAPTEAPAQQARPQQQGGMQQSMPQQRVQPTGGQTYTQPQQPALGQSGGQAAGGADPHVMPSGDDDVNLEELCSHDNPRNLYSDWKKVGEG
jgi:hypothetical protein